MILTREQRKALYKVYLRTPLVRTVNGQTRTYVQNEGYYLGIYPLTYREFRRLVQPGWDCIMLPWLGMWLGIEADGYTHS